VGSPLKDIGKICTSLSSGLLSTNYTEVAMGSVGFRKWQAIIKHFQKYWVVSPGQL